PPSQEPLSKTHRLGSRTLPAGLASTKQPDQYPPAKGRRYPGGVWATTGRRVSEPPGSVFVYSRGALAEDGSINHRRHRRKRSVPDGGAGKCPRGRGQDPFRQAFG